MIVVRITHGKNQAPCHKQQVFGDGWHRTHEKGPLGFQQSQRGWLGWSWHENDPTVSALVSMVVVWVCGPFHYRIWTKFRHQIQQSKQTQHVTCNMVNLAASSLWDTTTWITWDVGLAQPIEAYAMLTLPGSPRDGPWSIIGSSKLENLQVFIVSSSLRQVKLPLFGGFYNAMFDCERVKLSGKCILYKGRKLWEKPVTK